MQCRRCFSDNEIINVVINQKGLCEKCLRFDKLWGQAEDFVYQNKIRNKLFRIFNSYKKLNNAPDCIVGSCGGTDSLFVIYLLKREYGLNPLVVSVNNGFLNPEAKRNLEMLTDSLKVKYVFVDPKLPVELYRHFLEKTGNFCLLCFYVVTYYLEKIACEHKIKLIVTGMSRRYDPFLPGGANYFNLSYIIKNSRENGFSHEILDKNALFLTMCRMLFTKILHLPDYIPWDKAENIKFLEEKFSLRLSEKYDCTMTALSNYVACKKYGFDYHFLQSNQMLRNGQIKKEEALEKIKQARQIDSRKLYGCLSRLNLSMQAVDDAVAKSRILDAKLTFRLGQLLRNFYLGQRWF